MAAKVRLLTKYYINEKTCKKSKPKIMPVNLAQIISIKRNDINELQRITIQNFSRENT
jgi:hypothetical protein